MKKMKIFFFIQFSCGTIRPCSDDLCICNNEGEICLINIESNATLKYFHTIPSSGINCIGYIPSIKNRRITNMIQENDNQNKQNIITKKRLNHFGRTTTIDSLLEINSSDEDEFNNEDNSSLNDLSINISENHLNNEQIDTRQATVWLGTNNGK